MWVRVQKIKSSDVTWASELFYLDNLGGLETTREARTSCSFTFLSGPQRVHLTLFPIQLRYTLLSIAWESPYDTTPAVLVQLEALDRAQWTVTRQWRVRAWE